MTKDTWVRHSRLCYSLSMSLLLCYQYLCNKLGKCLNYRSTIEATQSTPSSDTPSLFAIGAVFCSHDKQHIFANRM